METVVEVALENLCSFPDIDYSFFEYNDRLSSATLFALSFAIKGLPPKGEWLEYCFEGTHSGLCNKLGRVKLR
jgi:hypothetical protein